MTHPTFRIEMREFDRTLREYMEHTKHALPDVVNKKAFFIARRAVLETPKANKQQFVKELSSERLGHRLNPGGRPTGMAPYIALIINARRRARGLPGLSGAEMEAAAAELLGARKKSVAFLRSGYLPAIRIFERLVRDRTGEPRMEYRGAEQIGAAKGNATPATPGWNVKATIENSASGPHDTKDALTTYGGPALQRAFDHEARSMLEEVHRRQADEARKLGIKIMG